MALEPSISSSCPAPPSSCAPAAAPSSSSSAAAAAAAAAETERGAGDSYIGSFISLTSKSEIRYEGVVFSVDARESTLGLRNVRSYGSEGRKKDGPQIPPTDKVYEYILFRGSDIKDLQVKVTPPSQGIPHVHHDPAVIQSQYATVTSVSSSSASVGGGSTDQHTYATSSTLVEKSLKYPVASPYQTGDNVYFRGPSASENATDLSVYAHSSIDSSQAQQESSLFNPLTMLPVIPKNQNYSQCPEVPLHSDTNITTLPEQFAPSNYTSNLNCSYFSNSNTDRISSCISSNATLLSPPSSCSFTSSDHELDASANFVSSRVWPSQASNVSVSSVPFSSSILGPASGPPLTVYPNLLTPNQFTQSAPITISTQSIHPEPKDVELSLPTASTLSASASALPSQGPLLPLPLPSQQLMEEFDFVAMNEKFNKDDVWGSLGQAAIQSKAGVGVEDSSNAEGPSRATTFNPVYNKDDFFDTLSCNSRNYGGWSGRNKFYERMKTDTQTFGGFQQRPCLVHRNNGAVDCDNFAVSCRGRGYGYQGFRRHGL